MTPMRTVRCAAAAAAVAFAFACSKDSTGPSDPIPGSWSVTLAQFADSTHFTPVPFTLTIAKAPAGGYTVSYPDLVYKEGGATVATYTQANDSSSFAASGDSLTLRVGTPTAQCVATIRGAVNGATAAGAATLRNGCGPNPTEATTWTATRQ